MTDILRERGAGLLQPRGFQVGSAQVEAAKPCVAALFCFIESLNRLIGIVLLQSDFAENQFRINVGRLLDL